jgi:hypothetical protein
MGEIKGGVDETLESFRVKTAVVNKVFKKDWPAHQLKPSSR